MVECFGGIFDFVDVVVDDYGYCYGFFDFVDESLVSFVFVYLVVCVVVDGD